MNGAKESMKTDEAITLLSDRRFLDKLYAYAYRHCGTSYEAEDLCSDMILAILKALRQNGEIQHFHAFAWTIAHRTYADYCEKRKRENIRLSPLENGSGQPLTTGASAEYAGRNRPGSRMTDPVENPIEDMLEEQFEREEQQRGFQEILQEMSFLSRTYRIVMVMYYLEERKIADIAASLGITENTVKQRLFVARKTIKSNICPGNKPGKEYKKMKQNSSNTNMTLKPISLSFIGTGDPVGNDPREKAERALSQNLIYLCKSQPKSAEELARDLHVPMPYIEQELEIQCRGVNGQYGMLRKAGQGKYISNILIVNREEYAAANELYSEYASSFCQCLAEDIAANREKILSLKQPGSPKDIHLLLWIIIPRKIWSFNCQVENELKAIFSDTEPAIRPFTCVAVEAYANAGNHFYGNDGISAKHICGYSNIYVENLYGDRLHAHFHCSLDISRDPLLLLTIRCVHGLALSDLSEEEREIAARAIQCGYLRKNGELLEPAIVVLEPDSRDALWNTFGEPGAGTRDKTQNLAHTLAAKLSGFMKKHIPAHLMGEYAHYNSCVASNHFFHNVVEECIDREILNAPENPLGPEGVLMVLQR